MSDLTKAMAKLEAKVSTAEAFATTAALDISSITTTGALTEERLERLINQQDPRPDAGKIEITHRLVLDPASGMYIDTPIHVLGYMEDGKLARRGFSSKEAALGYKVLIDQQ